MKTPVPNPARHSRRTAATRAEERLRAALRAQRPEAPEVFSDRDEDAAEYQSILRDFERVHDEALCAERYN